MVVSIRISIATANGINIADVIVINPATGAFDPAAPPQGAGSRHITILGVPLGSYEGDAPVETSFMHLASISAEIWAIRVKTSYQAISPWTPKAPKQLWK